MHNGEMIAERDRATAHYQRDLATPAGAAILETGVKIVISRQHAQKINSFLAHPHWRRRSLRLLSVSVGAETFEIRQRDRD